MKPSKIPYAMHVVGKALLLRRLGLFMTLVMAHAQALGQRVIMGGSQ